MNKRLLTTLFAAALASLSPSSSILAGTISSGTFTASNFGDAGGVTKTAFLNLTLDSGATVALNWGPAVAPDLIDFSGSFNFTNTYTDMLSSSGSGSVTVGGTTYTKGPNTTITISLAFVGPSIPYSSTPAFTSGNPFTATGSLTVVNNGITVFSDTFSGSGVASASRTIGVPAGGVSGTYSFTSTPEPATIFPLATGLAASLFALNRTRRSRC